MTSQRSLPPPDFAQRSLPTESVPAGASWVRIHGAGKGPLWFGPAPGGPPSGRFDDPQGEYRVCYLGLSLEAAFAEVFLRDVPVRLLPRQALHERALSRVVARESVRLVRFHGAGLAQLGATAEVAHGSHDLSRPWGRVCWEHPDKPDGLLYRARHDDDQLAIALFDRAKRRIAAPDPPIPLIALPELPSLLRRYGVGLAD